MCAHICMCGCVDVCVFMSVLCMFALYMIHGAGRELASTGCHSKIPMYIVIPWAWGDQKNSNTIRGK